MKRKRTVSGGGSLRQNFSGGGFSTSAFIGLTDVPHSYTGKGGYVVIVKNTEDGLEFDAVGTVDDHLVIVSTPDLPGTLAAKIAYGPGLKTSIVTSFGNKTLKFDLDIDNSTLDFSGTTLEVAPLGITDAQVATANKDGTAATPSMRTLGTGALQAAPGNIIVSVSNASDEAAAFAAGSIIVIRTDLI